MKNEHFRETNFQVCPHNRIEAQRKWVRFGKEKQRREREMTF